MGFIDEIKAKAKSCKKTIVLPESEDIRTYEAAEAILKEGTANLILIGSEEEIAKNKGDFDITGATIVDPATYEKTDEYVATLVELRKKKGMTEEQARELLLTNYLYYGVMMVKMKDADGIFSCQQFERICRRKCDCCKFLRIRILLKSGITKQECSVGTHLTIRYDHDKECAYELCSRFCLQDLKAWTKCVSCRVACSGYHSVCIPHLNHHYTIV